MPINKNYFCIFDFETDDLSVDKLNPLQLSAIILHPITLEELDKSEFNSNICPPELKKLGREEYYNNHKGTIDWHCRNKNISVDEMLNIIDNSPDEKTVWGQFVDYLKKYNKGNSVWTSVIPVGENISGFDIEILQKLCRKYGNIDKMGRQNIMNTRDMIEMKQIYFMLFHQNPEIKSYSADIIYDFLGLSTEGRHDSLIDVRGCSKVFARMMKYFRAHAKKTKFKGAFAK